MNTSSMSRLASMTLRRAMSSSTGAVRVGIIGAGRIGRVHAKSISQLDGAEVAMIADPFEKFGKAAAADFNTAYSPNWEDMLADDTIDGIVIGSPTPFHAEQIIKSAHAGKAIMCEKPISNDLAVIDECLKVVDDTKARLLIGFQRRFDANFMAVRRAVVAEGKIGQVRMFQINSRDPAPPPAEYLKNSGGIFLDMMSHDFDQARFCTGAEIESVYVQGAAFESAAQEAGDLDTVLVTLKMSDGSFGTIGNSRRCAYGYDQRIEVFGSDGMVSSNNRSEHSVDVVGKEGTVNPLIYSFFMDRYAAAYSGVMNAFVDMIKTGSAPEVTGADGRAPIVAAMAANKSLAEGRPVKLSESLPPPSPVSRSASTLPCAAAAADDDDDDDDNNNNNINIINNISNNLSNTPVTSVIPATIPTQKLASKTLGAPAPPRSADDDDTDNNNNNTNTNNSPNRLAHLALLSFLRAHFSESNRYLCAYVSASSDPHALLHPAADDPAAFHIALTATPRVDHNVHLLAFYASPSRATLSAYLLSHLRPQIVPDATNPRHHQLDFLHFLQRHLHLLDDRLGHVPLYNLAVVAYRAQRFHLAVHLVDTLFATIRSFPHPFAAALCLLAADLHFALGNTAIATAAVHFLCSTVLPAISPFDHRPLLGPAHNSSSIPDTSTSDHTTSALTSSSTKPAPTPSSSASAAVTAKQVRNAARNHAFYHSANSFNFPVNLNHLDLLNGNASAAAPGPVADQGVAQLSILTPYWFGHDVSPITQPADLSDLRLVAKIYQLRIHLRTHPKLPFKSPAQPVSSLPSSSLTDDLSKSTASLTMPSSTSTAGSNGNALNDLDKQLQPNDGDGTTSPTTSDDDANHADKEILIALLKARLNLDTAPDNNTADDGTRSASAANDDESEENNSLRTNHHNHPTSNIASENRNLNFIQLLKNKKHQGQQQQGPVAVTNHVSLAQSKFSNGSKKASDKDAVAQKGRHTGTLNRDDAHMHDLIRQVRKHRHNHMVMRKLWPALLNDMGIYYHRKGRHALATAYFEQSRASIDRLISTSNTTSTTTTTSPSSGAIDNSDIESRRQRMDDVAALTGLGAMKYAHIYYNLALQYMRNGNFTKALEYFSACSAHSDYMAQHSPLLWIRMAECCVNMQHQQQHYQQHNQDHDGMHQTQPHMHALSLAFEGRGKARRMIMRNDRAVDIPAMQYAVCCAEHALAILDRCAADVAASNDDFHNSNKDSSDAVERYGVRGDRHSSIDPSTDPLTSTSPSSGSNVKPALNLSRDMKNKVAAASSSTTTPDDTSALRGAAWTIIAFAALSFDARKALVACDTLSTMFPAEHERWTLAQLYAAEAYCVLGCPKDAVRRLTPLLNASVPLESDVREAAYVNMALVHACADDLPTACRAARVALKMYASATSQRQQDIRKQAVFAAAYIFLRNKDMEAARDALRTLHMQHHST